MEAALWKLEEKWKLSTHKAIVIFACTSILLIGMCVAAGAWRRRRRESVHQEPCSKEASASAAVKGWQSHNSTSAVWQRPILMGEKCELPRFSGLILYDQRGIPLDDQGIVYTQTLQEMMMATPVVRTTLRDLL